MKNRKNSGFGLVEIIIALAISAILGSIGYSTYQEQMAKTHKEEAIHEMASVMTDFEKFYSQNGSYAVPGGSAPNNILEKLAQLSENNPYYNFTCQPEAICSKKSLQVGGVTASSTGAGVQVACIVATPKSGSTSGTGNQYLVVDNRGNSTTTNTPPANCLMSADPVVSPTPEPSVSPSPTPSDDPVPSVSPTPDNPYPSGDCKNAYDQFELGIDRGLKPATDDQNPNCKYSAGNPLPSFNGNCTNTGGWASSCSGTCNKMNIFGGTISGNSNHLLMCAGKNQVQVDCSGKCNGNGDIWVNGDAPYKSCTGGCTSITIHYPKAWLGKATDTAIKNTLCDSGKCDVAAY